MAAAGYRFLPGALIAYVIAASAASPASAEPDPKRAVAVLEYRSGSAELRGAAERVAALLRATTSLEVIDLRAARQRFGASLDGRVAKCAGSAGCIAGIGRTLEVSEIVLVGVSQFGDVILTLQRIEVRAGKVEARIAEAMAPGTQPNDDKLRSYLERIMPSEDFRRFGTIRIETTTIGAVVLISGQERGRTPIAPIRVPAPASYDIHLDKAGYVPFRATIKVPADGDVKVEPVLELRGTTAAPVWYKRWWVWAIAGAVVAGTVTAVAATGGDGGVPVMVKPF